MIGSSPSRSRRSDVGRSPRARRHRAVWQYVLPLLVAVFALRIVAAPTAIFYRLSFPEPEHHWMQVEATFTELPAGALELHMSRSSPGRYALHEFAKNVYDVSAVDGGGRPLEVARRTPHQWQIGGHDGRVRVSYKVYGDRVDGTYLGIDASHAHINMPAALLWARGLEDRAVTLRLEQPPGAHWNIATQLHPTSDPLTFTAANLSHLMDSPVEFSDFISREFSVGPDPAGGGTNGDARDAGGAAAQFRIALHGERNGPEVDRYVADVQKIVHEERAVFGEFPAYESGRYTFLADHLPYAGRDGMEHRNSTVMTNSGSLRNPFDRQAILGTVAHEFFHSWNVERIRPKSLEPFNLDDVNMSGELWLAEGFTSYYEVLVMRRTGLATLQDTIRAFASMINTVALGPGRGLRSVEEMSRLAAFVDGSNWGDRTNWENSFISYYTWGAAVGLGLDLTLRDRTNGRVTLDDYMRAMWQKHGRPRGPAEGQVGSPYTSQDARARLAEVSGDPSFAESFFARYIGGHDMMDYERLLARAGLALRKRSAGRPWLGGLQLTFSRTGARVSAPAPFGSPAYLAGLDQDDLLESIDGTPLTSPDHLDNALARRKPGDRVVVRAKRRNDESFKATVVLTEDPRLDIVPQEALGTLGETARRFRDEWLGSGSR